MYKSKTNKMYILEKQTNDTSVSYFKSRHRSISTFTASKEEAKKFHKLTNAINYNYEHLHGECIVIKCD